MEKRMERMESMLSELIRMVGNTHSVVTDTNDRLTKLEQTLYKFQDATEVNFRQLNKRVDTRLKLIESDLDETMKDIESLKNPRI